jgi:ATP-binding cassette subfamily C (CFTR/MRP) protein 4
MGVSECWVSIGRINKYLAYPELDCSHTAMCFEEEGGEDRGATEAIDRESYFDAKETGPAVRISVSNATCYWNGTNNISNKMNKSDDTTEESSGPSDPFATVALDNISLDVRKGELTCIIGRVGCGKSALIQMLAGELEVQIGKHLSQL